MSANKRAGCSNLNKIKHQSFDANKYPSVYMIKAENCDIIKKGWDIHTDATTYIYKDMSRKNRSTNFIVMPKEGLARLGI